MKERQRDDKQRKKKKTTEDVNRHLKKKEQV